MNRSAIALVAGLLLCLTGCGKAADPPAEADPTVSVSPTKSGPAEPVMPDVASRPTKAGAIAFAKYYWRVANYAMSSLESGALVDLYDDRCGQCTVAVEWIRAVKTAGGRIIGGATHVSGAQASPVPGDSARWLVEMRTHEDRARVVGARRLNKVYAPGRATDLMVVSYVGGSWSLASWHSR